MNNLYIRKLTATQARGNQIDIPKTIVTTFFGVSEDVVENGSNESILVFHRSEPTKFEEIEIQGATNPRFSTKLNRFLENHGYELEEGDLLVVDKVGRSFGVSVIKKDTSNYDALEELFEENEKHMLLTAGLDESQHEAINEDKCGIILFAFDDPTKFVWECIKHFNRQECLKELFESKWFARSGFYNNYYTINGCFVAKEDTEGGEFENIEIFNNVLINNNFEVRTQAQIDGFIEAVNILFSGRYKILQEGDFENATYRLIKTTPIEINLKYLPYLAALRTKPFMLLAGISGTGKSRIVREFAFKSCPPALQDAEGTTPGNYCMIEVKPNWHDSTEILGYYSNIAEGYQYTKFIKFLVKAMMFPNVPFFVCLDEMNLAPVEQYFAEFLSVLETRKKYDAMGVIQSGVLVDAKHFKEYKYTDAEGNKHVRMNLTDLDWYKLFFTSDEITEELLTKQYATTLQDKGLSLPDNVFIIGTVNMDDTTHQFSRKVIDRAMTIEMNGGKLEDMFGHSADLQYLPEDQIMELSDFKPEYVNADEVMEAHSEYAETLQEKLVEKLDAINNCLKNTPFQVSYRVLNELCIYAGVLLDDGEEIDNAISKAVDQITLMKILPRIEGDEDMFVTKDGNKLEQLQEILGKDSASGVKLEEMKERLKNSSFTRFWP